jgi:hypothetical protein
MSFWQGAVFDILFTLAAKYSETHQSSITEGYLVLGFTTFFKKFFDNLKVIDLDCKSYML